MTLDQIAAKLDRNYAQAKRIEQLLAPKEGPQWVKLSTLRKQLGLTPEQIRYARNNNSGLARKKANGRYEYNLPGYKSLAA